MRSLRLAGMMGVFLTEHGRNVPKLANQKYLPACLMVFYWMAFFVGVVGWRGHVIISNTMRCVLTMVKYSFLAVSRLRYIMPTLMHF